MCLVGVLCFRRWVFMDRRYIHVCVLFTVLEVGDGVFEVLSTSGDTHLGGDDFVKHIVEWLA